MQLVQCSGAVRFAVDDAVSDALLEYALVLVTRGGHDLVRLPARDEAGDRVVVTLLLGPGAELSAVTTTAFEPVGDELTAGELRRRTVDYRAFTGLVFEDTASG